MVVEDNDPEDIRLAVVEMFERLSGIAHYDDEVMRLRAQIETTYDAKGAYGGALLARDFIKRNKILLD